jgi:hypothetical protein
MPNSKHLTHGISNLVSLITKTKLELSFVLQAHASIEPEHSARVEDLAAVYKD